MTTMDGLGWAITFCFLLLVAAVAALLFVAFAYPQLLS